MDRLSDPRFLQGVALLALIFVVVALLLLRARSRRREKSRQMRMHFLDRDLGTRSEGQD